MNAFHNAPTPKWGPDILGPGFDCATLDLGPDTDEAGPAVATLVRYYPTATTGDEPPADDSPQWNHRSALLWIHGLSDYFFHRHVAEFFHARGFAFYAVDLRKAGRSERAKTTAHYVSNLQNYFPDIDAAVAVLARSHRGVIPMAHSTGGLTATLWAADRAQTNPALFSQIRGLILNSPWLDLQFSPAVAAAVRMASKSIGAIAPRLPIPGNSLGVYGQSLYQGEHGAWDFNTDWKPLGGVRKYTGWMRAIVQGQDQVHRGLDIPTPLLTLCSTRCFTPQEYSVDCDVADIVLDVRHIVHWASQLGAPATVTPIAGARHDVFLSQPHALNNAFQTTVTWLNEILDK